MEPGTKDPVELALWPKDDKDGLGETTIGVTLTVWPGGTPWMTLNIQLLAIESQARGTWMGV